MSISEEQFLKKQSDFWSSIAQKWSLENRDPIVGWWSEHQAFQEYDTVLFRNLPLTGKEVVLEYGCGPARNIARYKDQFARIDGVDISPDCIEKAKVYLVSVGVPEPNLWSNDGRSLPMIEDAQYDIVFMVISLQHITSWSVRQNLYKEFLRVLKPGGYFVWQCGYGPGHPRSVDYFADSHNTEADFVDKDFRCEDANHIKKDLIDSGFIWKNAVLTRTCKDQHPAWLWGQVQKPS
jgi:SAM-dependent methyltransferase